jgi:hypothetical protein
MPLWAENDFAASRFVAIDDGIPARLNYNSDFKLISFVKISVIVYNAEYRVSCPTFWANMTKMVEQLHYDIRWHEEDRSPYLHLTFKRSIFFKCKSRNVRIQEQNCDHLLSNDRLPGAVAPEVRLDGHSCILRHKKIRNIEATRMWTILNDTARLALYDPRIWVQR